MALETILQSWVVTKFILPFFLIFFILFGILEKTRMFGDRKQLHALIAFAVGLIFVAAVQPKIIVENLTLFLTVAIVVVFVAMLLWGFIVGKLPEVSDKLYGVIAGVVIIAVVIATLWAAVVDGTVWDFLFRSSWSKEFWTNFAFIAAVIIALAIVVRDTTKKA